MASALREQQILERVLADILTQHEVSRINWLRLRNVFNERFTRAWRLVTRSRVKRYIFRPSGREIWVAIGNNAEYIIYPYATYCSCSDFYFRVLDQEVALCYHLLAQKLAEALDHYDYVYEDDEAYETLIAIWKRYAVAT